MKTNTNMNNQRNWKLLGLAVMLMLWPLCGAAQVNLDSGLVAYYPFDGNANDGSISGFDGISSGSIVDTTDRFGSLSSAFYFDGIDDYIDISSVSVHQNISISLWAKPSSIPIGRFYAAHLVGFNGTYRFAIEGDSIVSAGNKPGSCSGGWVAPYSKSTVSREEWVHLVWTRGQSGMNELFVDGVIDTTIQLSNASIQTCPNNMKLLGAAQLSGGSIVGHYHGALDEVRFYSRVLSAEEISYLFDQRASDIDESLEGSISLFPNPSPSYFTLRSPQVAIKSLALYDFTGRRLPAEVSHDRHEAQVRSSYRGLAIVKVQTGKGVWVQKVLLE